MPKNNSAASLQKIGNGVYRVSGTLRRDAVTGRYSSRSSEHTANSSTTVRVSTSSTKRAR